MTTQGSFTTGRRKTNFLRTKSEGISGVLDFLGGDGGTPNPILGLDNVVNFSDFTNQSNYTFSSGVLIQNVARTLGTVDLAQSDTGEQPEYDSTALDGLGGLKLAAGDNHVFYNSGGADSSLTVGAVFEIPTHSGSNDSLFGIGNSVQLFSSSRVFHTGGNRISFNRKEDTNTEEMINISGDGGRFFVILRFNSASSMDYYANTLTGTNLDPDAGWSTSQYFYIGDDGSPNGSVNTVFGEYFQTSDALTDGEIASIINYWSGRYGVTLI